MHRSSHDDGELKITMVVFANRHPFNRRPFLAACAKCGELPEPTPSSLSSASALRYQSAVVQPIVREQ
jgi:hypothetical protein